MPNTASAAKRARQAEKRNVRNRALKSRIKTAQRRTLSLQAEGDAEKTQAAAKTTFSFIDKAAKAGTIHRNKANRLKSRLAKKVSA